VRSLLEGKFDRVWVRGEVSDFKRNRGHWYFTLRDATAQIQCVVWSSDQWAVPAQPDDGMQVVALARMTFYAARGSVQLRVIRIEAAGDGLWRKAMLETVARLKAEGFLAPERKRPIPRYAKYVGVVTSPDGAALRDIISVSIRRRPGIRILVSPAVVQGEGAAQSICAAIARLSRYKYLDVIIVGRGGGSREDLWAFNDESVARAVAGARAPVISAVGHEIDTTVCDLVADYRAATPSAAAEAAVPVLSELYAALENQRTHLRRAIERRSERASANLRTAARAMRSASLRNVERRRGALGVAAGKLDALSPLATLARGYSVARDDDGRTLTSVGQFEIGKEFDLLIRDGRIRAVTLSGQRPPSARPASDGRETGGETDSAD
jgi:exodeoxyribonuclease VII large subunit